MCKVLYCVKTPPLKADVAVNDEKNAVKYCCHILSEMLKYDHMLSIYYEDKECGKLSRKSEKRKKTIIRIVALVLALLMVVSLVLFAILAS